MNCPQCDQNLIRVGQFWICPTHGQLRESKSADSLRIFLSYGHDANEELVRRIKADLEKRGHDVWFDKTEIKFGDEWRRAITDGILQSNRVLSFLSKHSTRDPGVCLDEIAIAIGAKGGNIQTILVESEREVKPPPSISHIQWLDMHDWKERRAESETAWEQWYEAKLAEIVAVLESDESRRFAGEIKTLEDLLKPTVSDFAADARIRQLLEKKLVGRTWLFEAVENWRTAADRDSRLFWIMGAPGIGKSAFVAHLAHEYGRGTVIAVQFCDWKKPDHRDACRIIHTLAFQMATRLPDYRKLLLTLPIMTELDRKNSAELFDGLLTNPLKLSITGGRERYLIVIDALDEAGGDGRNELVEVLVRYAGQLPDWIGLVVTSRPEFDVTTPFQALKPFPFETKSPANSDDIRAYLRRDLAAQLKDRPDANRVVEQILEKSEGVFLYVERFCDDIRQDHLSLDCPGKFPLGLGESFLQDFQRKFSDEEKYEKLIEPSLGAILAAREPLPIEILQKLFGWRETELRKWLRTVGSLFPVTKESGHEIIRPHHKSLGDWLADESKAGIFFVSIKGGHTILAELGWRQLVQGSQPPSEYTSRFTPWHLYCAGEFDRLYDFLCKTLAEPTYRTPAERVYLSRLPFTGSLKFIGRKQELAQLDLAFAQPHTAIIALVARGGGGKSALVQHWITRIEHASWFGCHRVYTWSFYGEGESELRLVSEDEFLANALDWFGLQCATALSPWDKGRLLADAIGRERTLLILDGLECLQYPPGPLAGQLCAPGVQSLLRRLARTSNETITRGLCVVTSRLAFTDLVEFEPTPEKPRGSVTHINLEP